MFDEAGISIIRLGLNPSEELSGGAACAGAYHPAFGELVRSRILLDKARALLLAESDIPRNPVLCVNKSDISAMAGQRRENLIRLKDEFKLLSIKISQADVEKGTVTLSDCILLHNP
jgi:hypothetical protein